MTPSRSRLRSLLPRFAVAVAVPLLFFAAVEGGLRLFGYGVDYRFFIPEGPGDVYRTNPRFTERFFPASFGLKPANFRLTKTKPPGTTRVFVLGESAAMGVPEPAFGLAPNLRALLRAARPDRNVEVYNLGVTAINSHVVLEIAREALAFSPDLLVVYMGNNEVVGPYGASSVVTTGTPPLRLIRLGVWLRGTRTGQLLQRAAGIVRPAGAFREWGGMEMFAGKVVADDDPALARVRDHFARNVETLLALAGSHDVPVVLSTVAVNVRDHAPFASLPAGSLPALNEAKQHLDRNDPVGAAASLEAVLREHPGHAEAHYLLARVQEERGDVARARAGYLAAWRHDALRFRADEEINARLRAAARMHPGHVDLVDAAEAMGAAASSSALAGFDYFFEHVHLTQAGNARLARLLAAGVARRLWPTESAGLRWPDDAALAAAIGFTVIGERAQHLAMEELTARPPFTGQSTFGTDRARLAAVIARLRREAERPDVQQAALRQLEQAVGRDPENPPLRTQALHAALHAGDLRSAEAHRAALSTLQPDSPELAGLEAFLLHRTGRTSEALARLRRAADRSPYYFANYTLLAALWLQAGELAAARDWFEERVQRWPESRVVRAALGQVLRRQGDLAAAEGAWRTVLDAAPDDERALAPLVELLAEQGRLGDARAVMERAFARNPRSYPNNERLVQLAEHQRDAVAQERYLTALIESGPVGAEAFLDLARLRTALGQPEEARLAWWAGQRRFRALGEVTALRQIETAMRAGGQN